MELKHALAVCLISLFSATLVVLIARSLDSQAAARLEPQLARIGAELEALRKQGGIAANSGQAAANAPLADGLVVYYFHGNTRCATCRSIETQAHEAVQTGFASQLNGGQLTWQILNYEQPATAALTKKFEIQVPVVVLARMQGGQIEDWKRLDDVWVLERDKPAFAALMRKEIERMLPVSGPQATGAQPEAPPLPADIPVPEGK